MSEYVPVSHPHEYYVDLVSRAPKTPIDELTAKEQEYGHTQYGNNFYLLFLSRLRAQGSPDAEEYKKRDLISVYLTAAETTYEKQWAQFLEHNTELIIDIDAALDGVAVYAELLEEHRNLLKVAMRSKDIRPVDEFEALGIELVGVYAWRQLNPLLEKAAEKMKDEGIALEEFFK